MATPFVPYHPGTVQVTNGSKAIVGTGTNFLAYDQYDVLIVDGYWVLIDTITDATHATAKFNYLGGSGSGKAYEWVPQSDVTKALTLFQSLSAAFTSGNVQAFAGLTGAADKLGYFTGAGMIALTDFKSAARTLLSKADASAMLAYLGADSAMATALTSTDDIDSVSDGWYRWVSVLPAHAPTGYAIMLQRNDGGQPVQIIVGGLTPQSIYLRRKTAGTWETFTRIGADIGTWNYVINGDFTINQRGAGSKSQSVGVYGYDRWKGHANGLEQVIEALPAGGYTLTWTGGGTGTFAGTTAASPIKATSAGGNVSVVVPANASKVSLVAGDARAADPFSRRSVALEDLLCRRYCEVLDWQTNFLLPSPQANSTYTAGSVFETYIHPKRTTPTVSGYSFNNITSGSVICYGTKLRFTGTALAGTPTISGKIIVDAEF